PPLSPRGRGEEDRPTNSGRQLGIDSAGNRCAPLPVLALAWATAPSRVNPAAGGPVDSLPVLGLGRVRAGPHPGANGRGRAAGERRGDAVFAPAPRGAGPQLGGGRPAAVGRDGPPGGG